MTSRARPEDRLRRSCRWRSAWANRAEMSSFYVPSDLSVTPLRIGRVMLLGGCMFSGWQEVLRGTHPEVAVEHAPFDYSGAFSGADEACDMRLVHLPLRYLYPEAIVMQARYDDLASYEQALARAFRTLRRLIGGLSGASRDRPTFFLNYPMPQRSAMGRLMPRYDPRNPSFYIQRLNRQLSDLADEYPGGHILDLEQIAGAFGRRFVQDDAFWLFGHGGMIGDFDAERDGGRLEQSLPLSQVYSFDVEGFIAEAWQEAFAMLRTLRGIDRVKMICIDLDDTLWRGVLAEAELDAIDPGIVEGWPMGFAEALMILKQRGILLAIISKNDEQRAGQIMERLFVGRLTMQDFAIRKINWRPKSENMAEAIREANILPEAVVYIDDNPVERAAMKMALPQVRTLEAPHIDWRRILLWSPETQVAAISSESAARTKMVQAQVVRERDRAEMQSDDFLVQLGVVIALRTIESDADAQFPRALELVNKTNQFNTTGARWTHEQARDHFAGGGKWWAFSVRDRYTSYGLVGVVVLDGSHLRQFVMSCRVFGLQVEQAAIGAIEAEEGGPLQAALIATERNGPCQHVYRSVGWAKQGDLWVSPGASPKPSHIAVEILQ